MYEKQKSMPNKQFSHCGSPQIFTVIVSYLLNEIG